ncbi:aminotransferase class I/II-fold pyridoxal phosphate-dependent enzyme [Aliikangiella sp. G2MR2-5]|uniref:aminotransferase class I/II-fold pyridoxal phosphate-dependent enzyme n=1 Tax=Aliikangiella sp. G2MR2-5 TaxID=2788943 RepID=UPI0018A95C04|nr:aminotransferase class I/II-fold pyridoxal phosphate-dependent enzyme [Aliikangiella sp. G2MR2-5]
MNWQIDNFIESCKGSSAQAYEVFKLLLEALDSREQRTEAIKFLHQLRSYSFANPDEISADSTHFRMIQQSVLSAGEQRVQLDLFQFPSTFLPEAWSFTFYEGLIRYPADEYRTKKVVELGCGIGWITLALALRYGPEKIYGVDINPKAIVCARLNFYLNAYNADASARDFGRGQTIVNNIEFHESNLFGFFKEKTVEFDKIVGCIPQVLNPEPEAMEKLVEESASDEYLYSLSNYFAKQGFVEDQFGLGLIASAVEQSIPLLKPDGKLILNLGGRPGRAVLERLMRRRGFEVRRVWQTQVEQAADTEIDALVDIEKSVGHRFEFYMSDNSDVSIDATTAAAYAKAGGKIYHSVDVYEAKLVFPNKVKNIFKALASLNDKSVSSAIDLTYDNYSDAEERYSFLSFLAGQLERVTNYPYGDTEGLKYFRQQLAEFFRYYLRVDVGEEQVFITPGRRELVSSLFSNFRPPKSLVCKSLGYLVSKESRSQSEIIEAPEQVEFLTALIEKLKPELVITQLDFNEAQSSQLVEQLIACAEKNNVLLLLDLTESIDLSSQPRIHGVYRYLSSHSISNNLILMAALVNNHVYQNYSLNITLANNAFVIESLTNAAELTYSRTPVLKQLYYAHLLEELLFFQRTRSTSAMEKKAKKIAPEMPVKLCKDAERAFSHPAITGNHLSFNCSSVRLDFGENELAAPDFFDMSLFESYLVRKCVGDEGEPKPAIFEQLHRRFNLPKHFTSKIVLGNGVAPIFSALLEQCAEEGKSIIIPNGSYGYFVAAAEYLQVNVIQLPTESSNQFKIDKNHLQNILSENQGAWLFINGPVVNPTGAIYSSKEMNELLQIACQNQATVILDTIFAGLEFDDSLIWDFAESISNTFISEQARLILLGGVSKEYAAGGIRFGYAWSTAMDTINKLDISLVHKPHFTLGYAVRKLLEAHLKSDPVLLEHLNKQRLILKERATTLTNVLNENGWHVIKPEGGLFLVAKPLTFINESGMEPVKAADLIASKLFDEKNLAINNSTWTGLPGYCRFVLSCSENDFAEAIIRLQQFKLSS